MTPEQTSLISNITAIISSFAAITAIIVAVVVEVRAHKRFSEQLMREEKLALANIKPILDIYASNFPYYKAVTLHNYGVGTAVITSITFSKGARSTHSNLVSFFKFDQQIPWDSFYGFRRKNYFVQAGQDLALLELTKEKLSNEGFNEKAIKKILDSCEEQMRGITIKVTYNDILGNPQECCETTLLREKGA